MCNKITIVKYFFGGNARNPTSSPARSGGPAWRFEQLLDNRHRLSIVVILHELLGILEDIVNEKDTPRYNCIKSSKKAVIELTLAIGAIILEMNVKSKEGSLGSPSGQGLRKLSGLPRNFKRFCSGE